MFKLETKYFLASLGYLFQRVQTNKLFFIKRDLSANQNKKSSKLIHNQVMFKKIKMQENKDVFYRFIKNKVKRLNFQNNNKFELFIQNLNNE
jgi:hypothetical protein